MQEQLSLAGAVLESLHTGSGPGARSSKEREIPQEEKQSWWGTFQEFQAFALLSQLTILLLSYFLMDLELHQGK